MHFVALLALTAAIWASAAVARDVSGTATYLARMALPPTAVLHVKVTGWQNAPAARRQIAADGRQVPLPFSIDVPEDLSLTLRLGLGVEGEVRWLSAPIPIARGTGPVDLGEVVMPLHRPLAFATRLTCGDRDLLLGQDGDTTVLETEDQRFALITHETASGARYTAKDDPETRVWTTGDAATVWLAGTQLPDCTGRPDGTPAPFHALGGGPDWSLALAHDGAMIKRSDREARKLPARDPVLENGAYRITWPDAGLALGVTETICRNGKAGLPRPYTVTLIDGTARHPGCGGDPAALIAQGAWTVRALNGTEISSDAPATLLLEGARVTGTTGCNRYFGTLKVGDDALSIGSTGATMMACPADLMVQERSFLDALAAATRFDIGENGALLFYGQAGPGPIIRLTR